jgi:hypothetical protein
MQTSTGRILVCLPALLICAISAVTARAEGKGEFEGALRLPTPAGQAVAEVSGTPALEFEAQDFEASSPQEPSATRDVVITEIASFEWRDMNLDRATRDWRFRGSLAQEDVIDGTTEWRFGAWIYRDF